VQGANTGMAMVECTTLYGHKQKVPRESLILRPAAYAILVHHGKALLLRMHHTGKYQLPGGGVKLGERIEDTLRREVREETGIEISVGQLADFAEMFFIYDPSGKAYHGLHFYYLCQPKTFDLLADDRVDDDAAEKPRWVEIETLQPQDFQSHGESLVKLYREIALRPVSGTRKGAVSGPT
jgi:8-oxo-dGTP pyrophosphatase MutT (NUDIX family)